MPSEFIIEKARSSKATQSELRYMKEQLCCSLYESYNTGAVMRVIACIGLAMVALMSII